MGASCAYWVFNGTLTSYLLDASSTPTPPVETTKNVFNHYKMSQRKVLGSLWGSLLQILLPGPTSVFMVKNTPDAIQVS